MITVFTPTYNRKKELEKLYKSILQQKKCNFEWLVIDDGSSDDTKEYITKIKKENKIKINYVYKKNGGKQSAYNLGLDKANGDIFLCIDSDDILVENSLEIIEHDFKSIKNNKKIAGMMYVQSYINNPTKIIGTKFPSDNIVENYFNIYHKLGIIGDKLIVLKTEIAKKYKFPIIKEEKFVPEALIFNRISLKYEFKCRNIITASKEYLDSGYSNNYFSLVKRNPLGNMLYYRELYDLEKNIYNIYGYILFGIYGKKTFKEIIDGHSAKILIVILFIPVFIISIVRGK